MRSVRVIARVLLLLLPGMLSPVVGCGSDPNSKAIEYCIPLEQGFEVPVARVLLGYAAYSASDRPALSETKRFLVSSETPITVVDWGALESTGEGTALALVKISFAVLDATSPEVVGRAAFWDVSALALVMPTLGPAGGTDSFDGILGGDLLRKYAVRLVYDGDENCALPWLGSSFAPPSIKFSEALPDSDGELSSDGFGVIDFDLAGGGVASVNDTEHEFSATRVAVGVCVEPDPYEPELLSFECADDKETRLSELRAAVPESGVDAFGLIATGTRPVVLSESFGNHLAGMMQAMDPAWPASGVSSTTLHLPEGPLVAQRFELSRLALVGNRRSDMGPCRELALRRRVDLAVRFCQDAAVKDTLGDRAAAVLELDVTRAASGLATTLSAYQIADTSALLTGLRAETSSEIPAVDLLIGAEFLRHFEVWLDYPDTRLVMRCLNYVEPRVTDKRGGTSCLHASAGETCCADDEECRCEGSACCQYYRWAGP
ncbi:MAG: hypothetical protein ABI333_05210 [bacterium]